MSGLVDLTMADNRYILCAAFRPKIKRQPVIPEQKAAARKADRALGTASKWAIRELREQEEEGMLILLIALHSHNDLRKTC